MIRPSPFHNINPFFSQDAIGTPDQVFGPTQALWPEAWPHWRPMQAAVSPFASAAWDQLSTEPDQTALGWSTSTLPVGSNSGILRDFPRMGNPFDENNQSPWSQPKEPSGTARGILGHLDDWNGSWSPSTLDSLAAPSRVGGGILALLERLNDQTDQRGSPLASASILGDQVDSSYAGGPRNSMPLSLGVSAGPIGKFPLLPDSRVQTWDRPAPASLSQQDQVTPFFNSTPLASAWQARPNGMQIAGTARPYPGIRPPIPPELVPGTPEWADHFIRGLQGLINAFTRSGKGGRGGRRRGSNDDDDDDECGKRLGKEIKRCGERKDEYPHWDFLAACKQRAKDRWGLCIKNKGQPDPNEPLEWGPKDEEIWRNYDR